MFADASQPKIVGTHMWVARVQPSDSTDPKMRLSQKKGLGLGTMLDFGCANCRPLDEPLLAKP